MAKRATAKPIKGRKLHVTTGDGAEVVMGHNFWRGEHATFRPEAAAMEQPDALIAHVLSGMMPAAPFIDRDTKIVAFGSCFARYVSGYLNNLGFDVTTAREGKAYVTSLGDGIVNSYAVLQQFEWAWEGRQPPVALWHGFKAEEFGYQEDVRLATRALFDAADVFIITLGLSEIWYDEPTGEVFWRAVPFEKFDATRHKFRVASPAENFANLEKTCALIRKHRPEASIVLTLSPIPLLATFRPVSAFAADAVSKASLRFAIDELMRSRADDAKLFYYPSYEVVLNCFRQPFAGDLRHPHMHVLDLNMKAFERFYCRTGLSDADIAAAYADALAKDRALCADGAKADWRDEQREWFAAHPVEAVRRDMTQSKTKPTKR
ncbi:MAG TPA: GSCFA domain-containing protein [Rhizomicrobium sp.]|nr:GSCFA domain-containing protein [Rhizomicrobium sp.]